MYRTKYNNELGLEDLNNEVMLSGWVQSVRNKGSVIWIDLRDRYGITQLVFEEGKTDQNIFEEAKGIGREDVLSISGKVIERQSKNPNMQTGEIEVFVSKFNLINKSETPPFTIENESDGGDELRMKYRYLDIRRTPLKENLILRHRTALETRKYLSEKLFLEIETPYLIKSTPEGARDFLVPSRMNQGQFYALPQSPQTFKQLLMVGGYDKYFQIVKCFRDEDLRADRQPEFTQIDCEMAFVTQEEVLQTFEGLARHLFKEVKGVELPAFERMQYDDAMNLYGSDKPDIRFDMRFNYLTEISKGKGFGIIDSAEEVIAIVVKGKANYSRKQIDAITDWVKRPQIGAKGMIYVKLNEDGSIKSSVDKFYSQEDLQSWADFSKAEKGDLILVLTGDREITQKQMGELRLYMAKQLDLINHNVYAPLWVVDFPLLEWDEENKRYHAMHHPFTSPKQEDLHLLDSDIGKVKANAYDMVINGVEVGGGSIRIHDQNLQSKMFKLLGFSDEEAKEQFGFLMDAFKYGAPPHGGIAFGFDRLCALMSGLDSIRDIIAFPKNNNGRDMMINAPMNVEQDQLEELNLKLS